MFEEQTKFWHFLKNLSNEDFKVLYDGYSYFGTDALIGIMAAAKMERETCDADSA